MLFGSGLLIFSVWLVYGQVFHFEFTNYDDPHYVFENPMVRDGFSFPSFFWALNTTYYDFWHPLTWWSHMLDCQLFGLQPGFHHLVNVAFHLANSFLLFCILARLTERRGFLLTLPPNFSQSVNSGQNPAMTANSGFPRPASFERGAGQGEGALLSPAATALREESQATQGKNGPIASVSEGAWICSLLVALLFAVHPMHVESVAWISERKDVLSTFGLLLSLGAYLGYLNSPPDSPLRRRLYSASLVAFALGLMAKSMIVTFPCVLLLLDFWPLGRMGKGRWNPAQLKSLVFEKWPFFALSLASSIVTYLTMKSGGSLEGAEKIPLGLRLANIPVAYLSYVWKLVCPHKLTAFYPIPTAIPAWEVVGSLLIILAITLLAWRGRHARPALFAGWFIFLGTLVPVIGLIANGWHATADRYTYIPSIGFFIAVVWTLAELAKNKTLRVSLVGLAAVVIAVFAGLGWRQTAVWKNSGTLWSDCLTKTKNNAIAFSNLGYYYRMTGETNLAIANYEKAFQLRPDIFQINVNLGAVLVDSGRSQEATNYYARAVALMPDVPYVYLDFGIAEMKAGDYAAALVPLKKAVELNPGQARPLFLQGMAFAELNQPANAIESYQRALHLEPANATTLYCLGKAWLKSGNYDEAVSSLNQAVYFQPNWAEAYVQLATACLGKGDVKSAIQAYEQIIVINPFHLPVLNQLAWLLATSPDGTLRNGSRAVTLARRACEQTTYTNADFLKTLAAAYAESGQLKAAVESAQKACEASRQSGDFSALATNQKLLQIYESGQPYHKAPGVPLPQP